MPVSNLELWRKIAAYVLPDDSSGQDFEAQLRAAHGINRTTARAAIEEYRRFIYLALTGEGRTVPSEGVDAVWHLHLSHSRDYTERFADITGEVLHHAPGMPKGHRRDFLETLSRYEEEFGARPPHAYWGNVNGSDEVWPALVGLCIVLSGGALTLMDLPIGGMFLAMLGGVIVIKQTPPFLRAIGIAKRRPLRDQPPAARKRQGSDGGGCGASCGASCGGGGCGGD